MFNLQVFALAEKYFVDSLLTSAAEKFDWAVRDNWDEDIFTSAVEEWHAITRDPGKILGKAIVNIIMSQRAKLFNPTRKSSRFTEVMNEIPWLGTETARALSVQMESESTGMAVYRCPMPTCGEMFQADMAPSKKFKLSCLRCHRDSDMKYSTWRKHLVNVPVVMSQAGL